MAYVLRAYWQSANRNGAVDRIEIHQDGFVGSAIKITDSQGFNFKHQELKGDKGLISPQENRILMGSLTFRPYICLLYTSPSPRD